MTEYPYADFSALRRVRLHQDVSITADFKTVETDRPFIILAGLFDRSLGGFLYHNVFAASVKLCFENARLHLLFRDDKPYLADIVAMNPHVDHVWRETEERPLAFSAFDPSSYRERNATFEGWEEKGAPEADLILTPWMMHTGSMRGFANRARLRVPDEKAAALDQRLADLGLDPERWFCTLHYREPTFGDRQPDPNREMDPADAAAATRHVIERLGGQVVRIGHPGMTAFPAMDGFVDISAASDGFLLQAHAVARSRCLLQLSDSGPMALSQAVGTPTLVCNGLVSGNIFDEASMCLPQRIVDQDGHGIPVETARRNGLYVRGAIDRALHTKGYRRIRNTVTELIAATDVILAETQECTGWRSPTDVLVTPAPNRLELPLPELDPDRFLDLFD